MKIGLAAYGLPFTCGFARTAERRSLQQIDAFGLAQLATSYGLSGIETPLTGMLTTVDEATLDRLRSYLEREGHPILIALGMLDVATIEESIPYAKRLGSTVLRATISTFLEGARAQLPGGWDAHFTEIKRRVIAVRPLLEEHDITLALENHQDATSDDLLVLCELGGPKVGITLDVANPLAVAEEPLAFARKIGPYIVNVHLKDYMVYATRSGYRLVRCALGEGVVPIPELLALFAEVAPRAFLNIELAALYARHIRLFEDSWWEGYPPRDVRDIAPLLRFIAAHMRAPDEGWETPWERQEDDEACNAYERGQLQRSVEYLRSIGAIKDE